LPSTLSFLSLLSEQPLCSYEQLILLDHLHCALGTNPPTFLNLYDKPSLEAVELLLSYGANPLECADYNISPLEIAIQKEYFDIADLLLNAVLSDKHE
jgi:ankyrin repeat protein